MNTPILKIGNRPGTVDELIRRLDTVSPKFDMCAIVVGFEDSELFIGSSKDRRRLLTEALDEGGMAVGIVAARRQSGADGVETTTFHKKLFDEYVGEIAEQLDRYLTSLLQSIAEEFTGSQFPTEGPIN